jgi:hypothetical protein
MVWRGLSSGEHREPKLLQLGVPVTHVMLSPKLPLRSVSYQIQNSPRTQVKLDIYFTQ